MSDMDKSEKKVIIDCRIVERVPLHNLYTLLKLTPADGSLLPSAEPGQFVQIAVPSSRSTFLRRPISINFIDKERNELWLLIRRAGDGTNALCDTEAGAVLNLIMPLGNGFGRPADKASRLLLAGGGVGIAPLYYLGYELVCMGYAPEYLIGARSKTDLLEVELLSAVGPVHISTDDGSYGEHGLVTHNSVLSKQWDLIYCCGPAPMMKAVAAKAREIGSECEVSLENMMACGLGACLCCVENTVKGNVCVCTEGPVFNINQLTW